MLKYLLGSAGLGFLYCRRELVQGIEPTATGWFADRDIFEMDIHDYSPAPTARRFEAGTPPVPSTYAAIAGIELMQEIGIAETEAHVRELNALLRDGLEELGATVVTPAEPERSGALLCVRSTEVSALVAALEASGHRHVLAGRQPADLGSLLQHGRGRPGGARRADGKPPAARLEPGTVPGVGRKGRGVRAEGVTSCPQAGPERTVRRRRAGTLGAGAEAVPEPTHLGDACA